MDTNKFVKRVKLLIKEEVRREVEKQKTTIRESVIKEMSTPQTKTQSKKPKVKFKGNKFSDLLNETVDTWDTHGVVKP